jgi:hypothetical protein
MFLKGDDESALFAFPEEMIRKFEGHSWESVPVHVTRECSMSFGESDGFH